VGAVTLGSSAVVVVLVTRIALVVVVIGVVVVIVVASVSVALLLARQQHVDRRCGDATLRRLVDPILHLEGVGHGLEDVGVGTGAEERGEDHRRSRPCDRRKRGFACLRFGDEKKPPVPVFDGLSIRQNRPGPVHL